ncbi:fungal-specific transcription factor domain-containing protein [Lactarius sanguifluus]|nr:fungal-specific transcription factor domain-containing protein [Lactarius sanguifluus]
MEPEYGTIPEGDARTGQPPPSRPADKPRKRPTKPTATAATPSHLPSPDLPSRPSLLSHAREEPQRSSSKRGAPDPRSALVHSFPAATHYPGYPHTPAVGHPNNGMNSNPMTGQNHPASYAYPVHHGPYPSHPYPHYSPYPQQIMMYAPPRPGAAHDVSAQPSPTANQSPIQVGPTVIREAESQGRDGEGSEEAAGPSGSTPSAVVSGSRANTQPPLPLDSKKRTKTQRACDSCRSRKIRCDILPDSEPPLCQHCKQYGFECTFFLPIAETRFKKKKLEEEAAEKARSENADQRHSSTPLGESSRPADARVYGPTSEDHLLHSSATIPSRLYENYDARHHHTWEVSQSGDGLIQVIEPSVGDTPVDMRIERDMVEKLVNAYFTEIAPILPVITQAEFLTCPSPPPILLYSICLVAAARRDVPQGVFDAIRYTVNGVMKADDVLSTASIANVQSLLILSMVGDCHSQFVPNALSALWIRLGTAIRMAQDLGLHRAEAVKQNIEMRRRLWGACLISDRCSSDLAVILGRVLKTVYSPAGLMNTTDEALAVLLADLENWKKNLPPSLQFRGPGTPVNAGVLFLLYSCVLMIFYRVFMRISYSCPEHLKFALTVESWTNLVELTGDAIDWLDQNDKMYDVWMLVAYAATSCALVQYHTWARRQDQDAAAKLKKLRDCVRRWEKSLSPDHMSARRKTAEIIALLYEATQGPPLPMERPALNPTTNVTTKKPPPFGGLSYERDPSRPGGGVFIAHGKVKGAYPDITPTVIIESTSEEEDEGEVKSLLFRRTGSREPMGALELRLAATQDEKVNVNPVLNEGGMTGSENVRVMNLLDSAPASTRALEQFAIADNNWLDGIPGGMFDWGL